MNHIIPIDESSRILVEDNNYTMQEKKTSGKGVVRWASTGYFPTVGSLLKDWVINAPTRASKPLHDLKELVVCIQNAERHIDKLLTK